MRMDPFCCTLTHHFLFCRSILLKPDAFSELQWLLEMEKDSTKKDSSPHLPLFSILTTCRNPLQWHRNGASQGGPGCAGTWSQEARRVTSFPSPVHPSAQCTICHRPLGPPGSLRNADLLPIVMDVWLVWCSRKRHGSVCS